MSVAMNKVLPTIATITALSAVAIFTLEKPATVDDVVKQAQWDSSEGCGNKVEDEYISFCDARQVHVVTAKELQAMGETAAVEQKLSELYGGRFKIYFDFTTGRFIKELGGYERTTQ